MRGEVPTIADEEHQRAMLEPLKDLLELGGWNEQKARGIPLVISPPPTAEGKAVSIGVFPSLLAENFARTEHPVGATVTGLLLRDYILQRDLPTTFQNAGQASRR
jgi:hypothetical protein